jgi:hypothetical protein
LAAGSGGRSLRYLSGTPRKGGRGAEQNRALQLLARSSHGCTEAIMLAHGFTTDLLVDLVAGRVGDGDARDRACWQAADQGCPGADHRCRTAGTGRMMASLYNP